LSREDIKTRYKRFYQRVPNELERQHLLDVTSWIWKVQRERMGDNRDLKIIITSRDGQTGTGKTTLSLWLAMHFDRNGFTGDKITVHPYEYKQLYNEVKPGSVLLMDEGEQLDSRRSMSSKNVDFWNLWQTMRFRQVTSILTLPTAAVLDKRGEELADVWINVIHRGKAKCHDITIGDYTKTVSTPPVEELSFPDVSYLKVKDAADQAKLDLVEGEEFSEEEGEVLDPDKIRRDERDKIIRDAWATGKYTQKEIAKFVEPKQQQISNIVNDA